MKKIAVVLLFAIALSVLACGCTDKKNIGDDKQKTNTEIYNSLPDQTVYNTNGSVMVTGKDLVAIDKSGNIVLVDGNTSPNSPVIGDTDIPEQNASSTDEQTSFLTESTDPDLNPLLSGNN